MHIGDVVKRSLRDAHSGVIVAANLELTLQHFLSDKIIFGVPGIEVVNRRHFTPSDFVIYNHWIGIVEEVIVETLWVGQSSGRLVRTYDTVSDNAPGQNRNKPWESESNLVHINHANNPAFAEHSEETFTALENNYRAAWVHWICLDQTLPPAEQAQYPEPATYWTDKLDELMVYRPMLASLHVHGSRLVFRDPAQMHRRGVSAEDVEAGRQRVIESLAATKLAESSHQYPRGDELGVIDTLMRVDVQWQDGTRTSELGRNLVPYSEVDNHEAWPGELVTWQSDDAKDAGELVVIQSFDSEERTAVVAPYQEKYLGKGQYASTTPPAPPKVVPALELDVYGRQTQDFDFWQYGLRRGELVMIGRDDEIALPQIPRLGLPIQAGPWMENLEKAAQTHVSNFPGPEGPPNRYPRLTLDATPDEKAGIDWCGVVMDLNADGTATLSCPSGDATRTVSLKNLSRIADFFGQEDGPMDEDHDELMLGGEGEYDARWMTENGEEVDDEMDGWEDDDDDDWEDATTEPKATPAVIVTNVASSTAVEATKQPNIPSQSAMDTDESPSSTEQSALNGQNGSVSASANGTASTAASMSPNVHVYQMQQPGASSSRLAPPPKSGPSWTNFDVLDTVPADHHYKSQVPQAPNRSFLSRIGKEHRSLRALPSNILVRTYSERLDLVRVLIFGSEGTPYSHGTFLFDFYLEDFPQSPPKAFFHHWASNQTGRISPNLYQNGTVCLSLLGTWSGESSESWQPSKSSLLQLFVSIASLVLVDEPYYTEPAYERLKGTQEGRLNAKLFKEAAFVATLGFVRRVLTSPVVGFEGEVKRYYASIAQGGRGGLEALIGDTRRLIQISEEEKRRRKQAAALKAENGVEDDEEVVIEGTSMEPLTGGAVIVLQRALKGLEDLQSS